MTRHALSLRLSVTLAVLGALSSLLGACDDGRDEGTSFPFASGGDMPPASDDGDASSSDDGDDDDDNDDEPDPTGAPPSCGDGVCGGSESCASCPDDCNACPGSSCGDGACDPDESCGSCEADCGVCCGDGTCAPTDGEDWTSCWSDCSGDAPVMPLADINPGCAGQTALFDGAPASDFVWIHAGSGGLFHVADDEVTELGGASIVDGGLWVGEEYVGRLGCQQIAPGQCTAAIVDPGYQHCSAEVPSHGAPNHEAPRVIDFAVNGVSYSFETSDTYVPCDLGCGNGSCDVGEGTDGCYETIHVCAADCG